MRRLYRARFGPFLLVCQAALLLAVSAPKPAEAQDFCDGTPRVAVVSAFAPELKILTGELQEGSEHSEDI